VFATSTDVATSPVGTSIIPTLASVAVTIALPLEPTYSATLLQPRQTLVELCSSIVGLLGVIGHFRTLFLMAEFAQAVVAARKRRLSVALLAASGGVGGEARGEPLFMSTNQVMALAAPAVDAEAAAVAVPEAAAGGAPPRMRRRRRERPGCGTTQRRSRRVVHKRRG
jgi:hypothetical protein